MYKITLYTVSTKIFLKLQLFNIMKKPQICVYIYPKIEGDLEHQNLRKSIY